MNPTTREEGEEVMKKVEAFDFDQMAYDLLDSFHDKLGLPVDRDGFQSQQLYVRAFERLTDQVDGYLNAIPTWAEEEGH